MSVIFHPLNLGDCQPLPSRAAGDDNPRYNRWQIFEPVLPFQELKIRGIDRCGSDFDQNLFFPGFGTGRCSTQSASAQEYESRTTAVI